MPQQLKSSITVNVQVNGAGRLAALAKETDKISLSAQKAAQMEMRLHQGLTKAAADRERQAAQGQYRLQMFAAKTAAQEEQRAAKKASMEAKQAQREAAAQARKEAALARQTAKEEAADQKRLTALEKFAARSAAIKERQAERERKAMFTVETETARLQKAQERHRITNEARARLGLAPTRGGGFGENSFLTGHGMLNRGRQMLAVARDITVAGMGIRYAIQSGMGMANDVMDPTRAFQSKLADVQNKGGFSAGSMKEISDLAMGMGRTSVFSPTQVAEAAQELAAAGLKAPEMKSALPSTLKFAQGSGLGTEQSSGLLVETMSQFGLHAQDFTRIGDTLIKSANMSTISVSDLGESMKYVGPLAAAAGMDLERTASVIGFLGERGIKGSQAGTSLRTIFASMVKPAKQAKDALTGLGLSEKDLQNGMKDLPGFFEKLGARMEKKGFSKESKLKILKQLFGSEGMTAATTLMGNTKAWRDFEAGVRGATGAMDAAAETAGNTLDGKLSKLNATMETSKIQLGNKFIPLLDKLLPKLTSVAGATADWVNAGSGESAMGKLGLLAAGGIGAGALVSAGGSLLAGGAMTLGGKLASSAGLGLSQMFLPTASQMTLAGAGLGTTLAAAAVAAIAGYGIGKALIAALDLNPEEWGSKIYDLIHGATPGSGNRQIPIAQAIAEARAKADAKDAPLLDTSGPLTMEEKARREAQNAGSDWKKVGALEINLSYDKPPKIKSLESNGLPLGLNVAPSGR